MAAAKFISRYSLCLENADLEKIIGNLINHNDKDNNNNNNY